MVDKVNVLGTVYFVRMVDAGQDEYMDKNKFAGYCDAIMKEIVLLRLKSVEAYKNEPKDRTEEQQKDTLRHEIVHAFFNESGLQESSLSYDGGWAHNEEMVDWIANQGEKLHKAWEEAGAI